MKPWEHKFSWSVGIIFYRLKKITYVIDFLEKVNPDYRKILKENGFLTRDSREVERKKPGQPGARKKFQFSKR